MRLSSAIIALLLLSIITDGSSCSEQSHSPGLTAAIGTLDSLLATRNEAISRRIDNASVLSAMCAAAPDTDNLLMAARAFDSINNDSAIAYTYRAMNLATQKEDPTLVRAIEIDLAHRLAKSSLFQQATDVLDRINIDSLGNEDKIRFYEIKSAMLTDAADTQTLKPLRKHYTEAATASLDTLGTLIDSQSDKWHLIAAMQQYLRGNIDLATGELNEVFDHINPSDPIYAPACDLMARLHKGISGKEEEYIYYLTLASIADIRNANGETAPLAELGTEFYKQGDLDRAYRYLSASSDCAVRSNFKNLYPKIVPSMSMFIDTLRAHESKRAAWITVIIVALISIVILCVALLRRSARKNSQRRAQIAILYESITARDKYIKQLLDLCSVYVDGMEEFNRLVMRKLKVNQAQDLYKMIESGKPQQDQTAKFFDAFDSAIANIYPDFIDELNSLLQPDKQMTTMPGGKLTPELRIVAFMRLGVSDSARMSKFLGLSINTIYTYRNRTKNRAINRDTFESDIFKIGRNT